MIGGDAARPLFQVTLDNWQSAGQLHYSFQHVAELFPTASISRGRGPVASFTYDFTDLGRVPVRQPDGPVGTVGDVMAASDTDGWMVIQGDRVLAEEYRDMGPARPHLLMSVSKSLVGSVVGILADQGVIDLEALVTRYVPMLEASGYVGATVRHLLDMRSGIGFSEQYLNPDAEVRLIEQAFGWATKRSDVPDGMYPFLMTLRAVREHGGRFEYRSCETDVLGWVCEAATGRGFPELMSDLLWSRTGARYDANIAVDSFGTGMFDGGISAAMSDVCRFGYLLANGGRSMQDVQVLPPWWVEDTFTGGPDSAEAFAMSPDSVVMPGGMYRNQFWFPYAHRDVLVALGIHGQMIYVNRVKRVVGVKLSSWPAPQAPWALYSALASFDAIAGQL